jgi:hypothetical protein
MESDINQGTRFLLLLNYPLCMPAEPKSRSGTTTRTSARSAVANEFRVDPVPITVLGSTTYIGSSPPPREKESTVQAEKQDTSEAKPSAPQKQLKVLYAEVIFT